MIIQKATHNTAGMSPTRARGDLHIKPRKRRANIDTNAAAYERSTRTLGKYIQTAEIVNRIAIKEIPLETTKILYELPPLGIFLARKNVEIRTETKTIP